MLLIFNIQAKGQQLPTSGSLSMSQIADYMLNLGEITQDQRNTSFSIWLLNNQSRLTNKTGPFHISDWRGYRIARTAKDLLVNNPSYQGKDGYYTVYPDGVTALSVYCDMTTDGGGWMLIARSQPGAGTAGGWGWNAAKRGVVNSFTDAYNAAWMQTWNGKATFTSILFGNRKNQNDNTWGPFKYEISGIDYNALMTSDSEQYYTNTTLSYDLSVYNTSNYPGMEGSIGYYQTGTVNNNFYMRDCCDYAFYGGSPGGMSTDYIDDLTSDLWSISGPWGRQDNAVDASGNFIQPTGDTHYGGTWQYMIFVR
jgi:hypothetical protein